MTTVRCRDASRGNLLANTARMALADHRLQWCDPRRVARDLRDERRRCRGRHPAARQDERPRPQRLVHAALACANAEQMMNLSTPACEVCGAPVEDATERFCGGDRCLGVFMPITAMIATLERRSLSPLK